VRAAEQQRPGTFVAVMLDTKGPEIRTGLLKDHKPIELVEGQDLEITTDYSVEGDNTRISCSYKALPTSVRVGSQVRCVQEGRQGGPADGVTRAPVARCL
jgi:pyruvate kinase